MAYAPMSKIVADLNAIAENIRLKRDGGFMPPPRAEPLVYAYDALLGSSFERQRVDSRYRNPPGVPHLTALRRKEFKQFVSAEAAKKEVPTFVTSQDGGEMPLPGPGRYNRPGTFGKRNADARIRDASSFKFATTTRFPDADHQMNAGSTF
ncbi:hypothetical protein T492DRAFT_859917 [Pavlovales sp. CCMP2436]|nr:hypothetical protein T492DRAFT_859917 [Pavlovales sp. CCMP2436]|mmetsp:Transcript_33693/g.83801  ORF Transcript_33693/g.83801 Transcript_33693/m.83801 type:complete len:151 (-) Transcript_33693:384-836(-)